MESESTGPDGIKPDNLLNLLGDAQASAASEALWPPNPLWHGPLIAAMIWGLLAFAWEQTTPTGVVGLAVALIGFYFTGYQYTRQRKVRGIRPTATARLRLVVMYGYTALMSVLIIVGWGQTVYRFGGPRPSVVQIVIGLVISSAFVTMGLSTSNALSRHWLGRAQ